MAFKNYTRLNNMYKLNHLISKVKENKHYLALRVYLAYIKSKNKNKLER